MSIHTQKPVNNFEQMHELAESKSFLYREFMLWVWFHSENNNEFVLDDMSLLRALPMTTGGDRRKLAFQIFMGDQMTLEGASSASRQSVLKGGLPAQSDEAAVALKEGKSITAIRLILHVQGLGDIQVTLDSNQFTPKAIRLPQQEEQTTAEPGAGFETKVEYNLYMLQLATAALDKLFSQFLKERISEQWQQVDLKSMKEWAQQRALKQSGFKKPETAASPSNQVH